ncbi:MAG: helix-turn-helix domain-containing protein [Candidatus Komeilibacteria bacterium]
MIRLSISESARLFGVSTKTIRQAIKQGQIGYVVVRNRYKLSFESVLKWSQTGTRRSNKLANEGIGQFVDNWKISNRKYSPNPKLINRQSK